MTRTLGRFAIFAAALGFALGLGTAMPRPAAAIDPCFGYDLCVHISIASMYLTGPNGSGVVTSTPAGISCNFLEGGPQTATSTCDWYFHKNFVTSMTIRLDAVADTDNTVQCNEHAARAASCFDSITFNASTTYSAAFDFRHNPITVNIGNAGKPGGFVYSTPMGLDCGEQYGGCTASWPYETSIVLYAEGDNGGVFQSWTGDCAGSGVSCQLVLRHDIATTAVFGDPPTPTPKPTVKPSSGPGATPTVPPGPSAHPTLPGITPHPTSSAATPGAPGATPVVESSSAASSAVPGDSAVPSDATTGPIAQASMVDAPSAIPPAASETVPTVPVGTTTPFDAMPIVIAIIVGCALIAIGIVAAAAVARRGRGTAR